MKLIQFCRDVIGCKTQVAFVGCDWSVSIRTVLLNTYGMIREITSLMLSADRLTFVFDPVINTGAFIERTGQAEPSTGKYMYHYDQLEEEFTHAHSEHAERKQSH